MTHIPDDFRPCSACAAARDLCPSCSHNRLAIAMLRQQLQPDDPRTAAFRDALAAAAVAPSATLRQNVLAAYDQQLALLVENAELEAALCRARAVPARSIPAPARALTEERKLEIRRWLLEAFVDPARVLGARQIAPGELAAGAYGRAEQAGDLPVFEDEEPATFVQLQIAVDGGGPRIARFDLADVSIEVGSLLVGAAARTGATTDELLELVAVVALRASVGTFAGPPLAPRLAERELARLASEATPAEIEAELAELHDRIAAATSRADLEPIERLIAAEVARLPELRKQPSFAYARAAAIAGHVREALEARIAALGVSA